MVKAEFSGSMSKGTAISLGTDADIFISLSSTTPGTLQEIYNSLNNAVVQSGYPARKQNVSIGTTVNGHKIDLVPGRRQDQYSNNHSLYRSKAGSWTKTNINTHINKVTSSKRTDEIKLTKIWRELHGLNFPSFYLELAVIDALKHSRVGDLSSNFWKVLGFLKDDFISKRYVDPANTNNVISDDLNLQEKRAIAAKASESRSQSNWNRIVW
ncbi:hypothetical protein Maes01_02801 [Microbulbifer aestuariivivens]|uniref:Nucleotidyltransferase n=2 Tax=Microbulbifer aestuariivivens TaxID=1908308 RepID=A0ABP9WSL5_9GAMM